MSRSFRLRLLSLEDGRLSESAYTHSSKSDSGSRSEEVGGKHGLRVDGSLGGGKRGGGGKRESFIAYILSVEYLSGAFIYLT